MPFLGENSKAPQAENGGSIPLNWTADRPQAIEAAEQLKPIVDDPFAPFDAVSNSKWSHVLCLAGYGRVEEALDLPRAGGAIARCRALYGAANRSTSTSRQNH